MNEDMKILRCSPRIQLNGASVDLNLHVLTMRAQVVPEYELMCGAVDDAIHERYLKALLEDIEALESGISERADEETESWEFRIGRNGVHFEGKFDQGVGGHVSLAQFKLAVETYLRFLNDPERRPIDVVFPD